MTARRSLAGALLLALTASLANAGTMSGVVKELKGNPLANVRIVVVDVTSNTVLQPFRSGPNGEYTIEFPDFIAASITFDDGGVHEEAALIGIPGSIKAESFDIFMPDRRTDDAKPCPPCKPFNPCCKPARKHCKRLFRR